MNRQSFFAFFAVSFLCTILVVGCGGGMTTEQEPNNSIDEAENIPLDWKFKTKIQEKKDTDWFKTDLSKQGYLRVKAEGVPEELGLEVRFALKEEWKGNKVKPIRGWNELPESVRIPEKGTYYIQLRDDYNDAHSDKAFEITAEFLEEFDSFEINDGPKQASSVDRGQVIKPAIYPTGDYDWFKINVKDTGYLSAKESDVPGEIDPEVRWVKYDKWSDPKVEKLRGWNDLPDAVFVPKAGEYYVEVRDDYNDGQSTDNFKLKLDYMEPMDPHEPNDGADQAAKLTLNKTVTVSIFPVGDQDYFRFSPKKDGTLKIRTSGDEGVDPEVALYYELDNGEWSDGSDWKNPPTSFAVRAKRTYLLRLHDDYDDQRSPKTFKVRTKLETE